MEAESRLDSIQNNFVAVKFCLSYLFITSLCRGVAGTFKLWLEQASRRR